MNWHRWLIEIPAHVTETTWYWYRFLTTWYLIIGGMVCWVMVLTALSLWFGLGIRWGW